MIAIGQLLLTERVQLPCPQHVAFELVRSGGVPGWQLARGRALEPGAPLTLPLQLPANFGGQTVDVLGRVQSVRWPDQLVIRHSLPWRGSVSMTVNAVSDSSSEIRIVVRLDEDALDWASRYANLGVPEPADGRTWRLGVLTSASGTASVFSAASMDLATLAMEEINADGGVLGRDIELVFGDDGTHPGLGAAEIVRLARAGCRVVVTNVTSVTFRQLRAVARRLGVLLVHAALNEGGTPGGEVVRLGERPGGQLTAAVPVMMAAAAGSRWYLAGSNYCWPRSANRAARRVISTRGGEVLAESYMPFGSLDFSSVINEIKRSGADLLVSTFVGSDEVAFEQQAHAAGLRERVQTVALVLDESTHDYIGPEASEGLWAAFSYFQDMRTTDNGDFLARYQQRFGAAAAPVSSLSESLYEGIYLVALAARGCRSVEADAIAERLRAGVSYSGPRGPVQASWQGVRQAMYVAQSRNGVLAPVKDLVG